MLLHRSTLVNEPSRVQRAGLLLCIMLCERPDGPSGMLYAGGVVDTRVNLQLIISYGVIPLDGKSCPD
jgi:hypothetical protein